MSDGPKIHITCTTCSHQFSIPVPPLEITNNFQCSAILIPHEKLIRCTSGKCRQPYVLMVGVNPDWSIAWNVQPVGEEIVERIEGSRIIKPTNLEIVGSH